MCGTWIFYFGGLKDWGIIYSQYSHKNLLFCYCSAQALHHLYGYCWQYGFMSPWLRKMVSGRGYWLTFESWGFFFWIYILNRRNSFMDLWNMISFVMPIIFDMYWNFVYQYHDNLVVMSVNTRKIVDLKDEIYLKLMTNFLNLSLTF